MAGPRIFSGRFNLRSVVFRSSPRFDYYIFVFVFLLRLISLGRLTSSSLLFPAAGDMHFYDEWARQIVHGHLTDHLAFYGQPLYAFLLAGFYMVFGNSPFVPGFFQAGLDAGTATLLYKIAIRLFAGADEPLRNREHAIGILAAVGWAFFVPAQAYSLILMPTTWVVFVFWLVVWRLVSNDRAPAPLSCLGYGALIGITAIGVATILLILPLVLMALLLKPPLEAKTRSVWAAQAIGAAMLFLGVGLGTAPSWIHNYFVAHDAVFLSAHSGINFWLGNNPDATGYPHFPGLHAGQAAMLKDSINIAEAAAGRSLKRSEVSAYWTAKAYTYITQNLSAWLKLTGRKLVNFWNAFEYDDINIIDRLRNAEIILPGLHFGLIAALALPGICLSVKRFPGTRWIAAAIVLHLCAVLPVFITERYRLAAAPGLMLFAAAGLWLVWRDCSFARWNYVLTYFLAVIVATGFVSWPQRSASAWALKFYNSGSQALDLKNWTVAQKQLEMARSYVPDNTEINLALGNLWLEQGNLALAEGYYRAVLQIDPKHKAALTNLAVVASSRKQWQDAATYLRAALTVDPTDGKTHYLYAKTQLESGNISEALSEIEIALRLRPGQREFQDLSDIIRKQQ